jgi:hypothetical protein
MVGWRGLWSFGRCPESVPGFYLCSRFMNHRVPAHKRYQPTEYEHAANCATHAVSQPGTAGGDTCLLAHTHVSPP